MAGLRISDLVVASLYLSLVVAQASSSFLVRYPVRTTDVLGGQLNTLFDRLQQQFASLLDGTSPLNGSASVPTPEPMVPGDGKLPGGDVVEGPLYRVLADSPKGPPTSSLIVLHGMDSKPEDLVLLALPARSQLPNTRFVFVRSPTQHVSYLGRKSTSWFDITRRAPGFSNILELRQSAAGIARLIELEKSQYNVPSEKVVVLGMSQGGAVAIAFYLAEKTKVAGIIGAATWLPIPRRWQRSALPSENAETPIFLLHGTNDNVIPINEARDSAKRLRQLGRRVKFREYRDAGHIMYNRITTVVSDILRETKVMLGE